MSQTTPLRVVLYDRQHSGHHLQHVRLLSQYLLRHEVEVRFVTTPLDGDVGRLPTEIEGFGVKEVEPRFGSGAESVGGKLIAEYGGFSRCLAFAEQWNADVVHHMSVDRHELAVLFTLLQTSMIDPPEIYATLVTPYYRLGRSYLSISRLYHWSNSRALYRLLRTDQITRLFVLSDYAKSKLQALWTGLHSDSIVSTPDPVVEPTEQISQRLARQNQSLPADRPTILFFGTMRENKGPDILLEAVHHLPDEAVVCFAGTPVAIDTEDIARVREKLSDPSQIEARLGLVPDSAVQDYFQSADVVALPYRSSYCGTSGVLQHAAATATPVVATDCGQVGSLVRDWDLGTVVAPESPEDLATGITRLLDGGPPDVRSQAEKYVEAHHWENWAEEIYGTYVRECR